MSPDEESEMEVMIWGTEIMNDYEGNVANIVMIVFALCVGKTKTDGNHWFSLSIDLHISNEASVIIRNMEVGNDIYFIIYNYIQGWLISQYYTGSFTLLRNCQIW